MRIRLTKLSDSRHAMEVERNGRRERVELETRSTLNHDLTHLAVEEAARIEHGFFGSLAAGKTFAELAGVDNELMAYGSMMEVERGVAVLQSLAKVDEDPSVLHARITGLLAVQGESPPKWFTVDLVAAVRGRLRELLGRWRATPYGGTVELTWPANEERKDARPRPR